MYSNPGKEGYAGRPVEPMDMVAPPELKGVVVPFLTSCLWLLMMSASLIESYAYRYAGGLLVCLALFRYWKTERKPAISRTGWICLAWGGYALMRFLAQFILLPDHPLGDHDLLFLMPLAFPPLALIFLQCWSQMERLITIHFILALAVLLFTTRFGAIFNGETVRPLIQHNQIHGAVCCGILMIGSILWMLHYRTGERSSPWMAASASIICPLIVAVCLVAVYGAKSKGVWLSLGLTFPLVILVIMRLLKFQKGLLALAVIVGLLAIGIYGVRDNIDRTAGPTFSSTVAMLESFGGHDGVSSAVAQTIKDGATPISMDERLQLWSNAWQLFSMAPLFGWGSEWLTLWPRTHYQVNYTIMHNGYLEILVRYGVVGFVAFAAMLVSSCISVYRAACFRIIPATAFNAYWLILLFFGFTILSNSNNRLAIGESLALLSSAFALACEAKVLSVNGSKKTG